MKIEPLITEEAFQNHVDVMHPNFNATPSMIHTILWNLVLTKASKLDKPLNAIDEKRLELTYKICEKVVDTYKAERELRLLIGN